MICYNCGCRLSDKDFCTACGADVAIYKKVMFQSNILYNQGLERARVRNLSGAIVSLRQSLKFNKNNVEARNLLGLVYYELGEVVQALGEWIISKNLRPEKNIADDYISAIQDNPKLIDEISECTRKYNQALEYCYQEAYDLAVIQLKKVCATSPRYLQAHQLLALLYIRQEEWEKASKEVARCEKTDLGNTITMRYRREIQIAQEMSGESKIKTPENTAEVVRRTIDNETIIQPVKHRDGRGLSAAVNIGIGIAIGIAVAMFLIVPSRLQNAGTDAKEELKTVSEQLDRQTATIEELTNRNSALISQNEELKAGLSELEGAGGSMEVAGQLMDTVRVYMEKPEDISQAAAVFETMDLQAAAQVDNQAFRNLYEIMLGILGPSISDSYAGAGMDAYRKELYQDAILNFLRASQYDPSNGDVLFNLGNSYRKNGDREEAIRIYNRVIEEFEGTERARRSKTLLEEMNAE